MRRGTPFHLGILTGLMAGVVACAAGEVNYAEHVAEILIRKCGECHRRGGAAPFTLSSYREAMAHAPEIVKQVESQAMPPWQPQGALGEFQGDRRLSESERQTLHAWFQAGFPEGPPEKTPLAPYAAASWQLGAPDYILQPQPLTQQHLPGTNIFMADLPSEQDGWVQAIEILPKDAGFQQALLWLDLPLGTRMVEIVEDSAEGETQLLSKWKQRIPWLTVSPFRPVQRARAVEARDRRLLGVWSFDEPGRTLPPGVAWRFPAGSRLVVEMNTTRPAPPLEVGLHLAEALPKNLALGAALEPRALGAGVADTEQILADSLAVPVACEMHGLAPHAAESTREIRLQLVLPSGKTESLLWINAWNPRWERHYTYRRPVQIPAGSKLETRFVRSASRSDATTTPLLTTLLTPVKPSEYDELARALEAHQIAGVRTQLRHQ